mgnify:CR=1 FL=1|tara:strand:+ start:32 stop:217 length:186 start_codon:yes stop_codon:yes gene_type:complete
MSEYVDMLVDGNHRKTKDEHHLYAKMMRKRRRLAREGDNLRKENARTYQVKKKPKKYVSPL